MTSSLIDYTLPENHWPELVMTVGCIPLTHIDTLVEVGDLDGAYARRDGRLR